MIKKILSVISISALFLLALAGSAAAQTAYGSGNYGDCVYGGTTSCGNSQSGSSPTVVILNNDPLFNKAGQGIEISLKSGTTNPITVEFYTLNSNGSANSSNIYEVNVVSTNDLTHSTVLSFPSVASSGNTPVQVTITQGQTVKIDANSDGITDLSIKLYSESNGIDVLYFHAPANKHNNGNTIFYTSRPPASGSNNGNSSGIVGLLKRVVNALPDFSIVTIPSVLLLLLILIALWAGYQAFRERAYLRTVNRLLDRLKLIAGEKATFLNLSSHYLRTPLTQISGGVELLAGTKSNPELTGRLQGDVNSLKAVIDDIIAKSGEIQSPNDDADEQVAEERSIKSKTNRHIWIMVAIIGIVIVLTDTIVREAKHLSVFDANVITEITLYFILAAAIYSSLRYYQIHFRIRKENEKFLSKQRGLDDARDRFINEINDKAAPHISSLINIVPQLPQGNVATRAMSAGIRTFQSILGEFKTLAEIRHNEQSDTSRQEINESVNQIIGSYKDALGDKKISLNFNQSKGPIYGQFSMSLLRQLVGSIIDNAIKFSSENGQIDVGVEGGRNKVKISVRDNGTGIAKDSLDRLFEPFTRAGMDVMKFNYEGLGFNLYLDKIILDGMGGKISIDSSLNEGTTVSLWLPVKEELQLTGEQVIQPQTA